MGPFVYPWLLEHPAEVTNFQWMVTRTSGFLLLAFLVGRFVLPAIRGMLDARARSIEETQQQIDQALLEAEQHRKEYSERLASIAEETDRRMHEAVAEAEVLSEHIKEESRAAAAAIVEHARSEVARDRERALAHLRIEFTEHVIEAARYAAAQTLTDARQSQLVYAFVREIVRSA